MRRFCRLTRTLASPRLLFPPACRLLQKRSSVAGKGLRFLHVLFIKIIFRNEHKFYEFWRLNTIARNHFKKLSWPRSFIALQIDKSTKLQRLSWNSLHEHEYKHHKAVVEEFSGLAWWHLMTLTTCAMPFNHLLAISLFKTRKSITFVNNITKSPVGYYRCVLCRKIQHANILNLC